MGCPFLRCLARPGAKPLEPFGKGSNALKAGTPDAGPCGPAAPDDRRTFGRKADNRFSRNMRTGAAVRSAPGRGRAEARYIRGPQGNASARLAGRRCRRALRGAGVADTLKRAGASGVVVGWPPAGVSPSARGRRDRRAVVTKVPAMWLPRNAMLASWRPSLTVSVPP